MKKGLNELGKVFNKDNINDYTYIIIIITMFLGVFIFFALVHPLVLFDGDDWYYIYNYRKPIPIWGDWNPARVFPEVLMPLIGYLSAYIVLPFVHDYISSVAITCAFLLASLTTLLVYKSSMVLNTLFDIGKNNAYLLGGFLVILHFAIFKTKMVDSTFLLIANDVAGYFFYVIPGLLNALFVMRFLCDDKANSLNNMSLSQRGYIIIFVYFSIFSNLFDSIILAAFSFSHIIVKFIIKDKQDSIKNVLSNNLSHLAILLLWLTTCVYELNGGRSGEIGKEVLPVFKTFEYFKVLVSQMDHTIGTTLVVAIILSFVVYLKSVVHDKIDHNYFYSFFTIVSSMIITTTFLIIVCAKSFPEYGGSAECVYGTFFYFLVLSILSVAYLIHKYPVVQSFLPMAVFLTFVISTNSLYPFVEPNQINIPHHISMKISRNFIDQVINADKAGKNDIVLKVPAGDSKAPDNWPHPISCLGYRISHALFAHGDVLPIN